MRTLLFGILLLATACRRPSTQFAAMLTPVRPPADYSQYLKAGDELVALGNDPAWSLTINPSKGTLIFKSSKDSLATSVPERQTDSDGVLRYNAPVGGGTLNIVFRPDSCVDAKTGQPYDYRVQVDSHEKHYVGCGVSLQKLTLLQDIWVLTEFQGKAITADASRREVPRLEISLTEGRVTGTTGCNRLSGPVKADTRQIVFGPLITTKMACIGAAGDLESPFLNALNAPLSYQIGSGRLTLLQNGAALMVFKKVD
ncbi:MULTISPECIES: META domain-containing protein [unclassified Spirosoma]|uniref:META domain-containing protein n=1 Tax=unclassified Spirosoma TaxID=2621999 RepID=UPI000969F127|nr:MULTISPECIES: META domain-containing protein [unclassified Spirosoma]MBN8821885.1 META domain-containing protein [Spirosoma sp.]OJW80631.1 MAG: META domain-containing protein [Spirosoma sp. 48-14]